MSRRWSSAFSQAAYYGVGLILMKGISFLMLPVITHYLSPAEYGQLDILVTWLNLGGLLLGLGLTEALFRFAGQFDDPQQKAALVRQCSLIATTAAGIGCVLLWWLTDIAIALLPGDIQAHQWQLSSVTLMLMSLVNIPLAWLRLTSNAKRFFQLSAGKAALQALLTWYLLSAGWGLDGVLWSSLISSLILSLLLVHDLLKPVPTSSPLKTRDILVYGSPLVMSGLLLFLGHGAEKWVLAHFTDPARLAPYAVAVQFTLLIAFLAEPFTLWWHPKRFGLLQQPEQLLKNARVTSLGVCINFALAASIAMTGPALIRLWLPAEYISAGDLLPWLCLGMALKQAAHLMNLGCYIGRNTWVVTRINALLASLAFPAYLVTAYVWAEQGVVAAFIFCNAVRLLLLLKVSQRLLALAYDYRLIMASSLLLGMGVFASLGASLILCLVLNALTLGLLLGLFCYTQHLPWPNRAQHPRTSV